MEQAVVWLIALLAGDLALAGDGAVAEPKTPIAPLLLRDQLEPLLGRLLKEGLAVSQ